MNTTERFNFLIGRYVEDRLSIEEKDEFFRLISSGDYDDIFGAHFDKSLTQTDTPKMEVLPGAAFTDLKKMISDLKKTNILSLK